MQASAPSKTRSPKGRLRVLETTDLHMQLLDYDYFADGPDPGSGLIALADQIQTLRQEDGVTTLLCDNGDALQGNPLADYLAARLDPGQAHPMIAAFNLLRYDAMTLGNHEFDYGLQFLRDALSQAEFPVVSANITCRDGSPIARPFSITDREILCDDGIMRPIRIGITGFGPPQIEDRDDPSGNANVRAGDIVDAARKIVPQMRAARAELIIALCHTGIGAVEHTPRMENAAVPLAGVDGIDVLLMGHTHDRFPNPAVADTVMVDFTKGRLHRKPAIMPLFGGKSLGVIDLDLQWDIGGWTIADHNSRLLQARPARRSAGALQQRLRDLVAAPHAATRKEISVPIAATHVAIVSYFAKVQPDLCQQLLALAMQTAVTDALAGAVDNAHPVLAATSPFRFGGRSGAGQYIAIPPGPLTLRDAAAIFPFSDRLCAVRRSGRDLRLWLERSAAHYNRIVENRQDQPLINMQSAGYNCDTITGLSYQIDLTQPARFDAQGNEVDPRARRITQIRYGARPVRDEDIFVVATNSFRAGGGGGFPAIAPVDILYTSKQALRAHLIAYLKETGTVTAPTVPTWSFAAVPGASAIFDSAPQAVHHLPPRISHIGPGRQGFARYRINF